MSSLVAYELSDSEYSDCNVVVNTAKTKKNTTTTANIPRRDTVVHEQIKLLLADVVEKVAMTVDGKLASPSSSIDSALGDCFVIQRTGYVDLAGSSDSDDDAMEDGVILQQYDVTQYGLTGQANLRSKRSELDLEVFSEQYLNDVADDDGEHSNLQIFSDPFLAHRAGKFGGDRDLARTTSNTSWSDGAESDDSEAVYDRVVAACSVLHKQRELYDINDRLDDNRRNLDLGFCDKMPEIEKLHISAPAGAELWKLGEVASIVDVLVIIKSEASLPPLDQDSVCFTGSRKPLGKIFETFGPVTCPFYSIRFNNTKDIEELDLKCPGEEIYFAPGYEELTVSVFVDALRRFKGTDSKFGEYTERNAFPDEMPDFSDDEEEKRYLAKHRRQKAGTARDVMDNDADSDGSVASIVEPGFRNKKYVRRPKGAARSGDHQYIGDSQGKTRAMKRNAGRQQSSNYFSRGFTPRSDRSPASSINSGPSESAVFQLPTVNLTGAPLPPSSPLHRAQASTGNRSNITPYSRPSNTRFGNHPPAERYPGQHLPPKEFLQRFSSAPFSPPNTPPSLPGTSSLIANGSNFRFTPVASGFSNPPLPPPPAPFSLTSLPPPNFTFNPSLPPPPPSPVPGALNFVPPQTSPQMAPVPAQVGGCGSCNCHGRSVTPASSVPGFAVSTVMSPPPANWNAPHPVGLPHPHLVPTGSVAFGSSASDRSFDSNLDSGPKEHLSPIDNPNSSPARSVYAGGSDGASQRHGGHPQDAPRELLGSSDQIRMPKDADTNHQGANANGDHGNSNNNQSDWSRRPVNDGGFNGCSSYNVGFPSSLSVQCPPSSTPQYHPQPSSNAAYGPTYHPERGIAPYRPSRFPGPGTRGGTHHRPINWPSMVNPPNSPRIELTGLRFAPPPPPPPPPPFSYHMMS